MPDNTVTIVGNIARDPELRFTASGIARANFSVAVNRRWRDGSEWKEETSFFNVTAWRDLGEHVAESIRKGMRVILSGRLVQRSWETPEGERRSVVEIQCDDIGPSLRWATAQVTRVERHDGQAGPPNSVGGRQNQQQQSSYGYDEAEEPF